MLLPTKATKTTVKHISIWGTNIKTHSSTGVSYASHKSHVSCI